MRARFLVKPAMHASWAVGKKHDVQLSWAVGEGVDRSGRQNREYRPQLWRECRSANPRRQRHGCKTEEARDPARVGRGGRRGWGEAVGAGRSGAQGSGAARMGRDGRHGSIRRAARRGGVGEVRGEQIRGGHRALRVGTVREEREGGRRENKARVGSGGARA